MRSTRISRNRCTTGCARLCSRIGWAQFWGTSAPASAVTDAVVPIYAKAFSMEDLQGLIQFYESPLGQRVVKTLPEVAQSSQRAGVQLEQKGALTVLQGMS